MWQSAVSVIYVSDSLVSTFHTPIPLFDSGLELHYVLIAVTQLLGWDQACSVNDSPTEVKSFPFVPPFASHILVSGLTMHPPY